jgi:hypothetical protein
VTIYTGEVLMSMPYVVDMDDEEQAEYEMLVMAKEDFPEASKFSVQNIKKQN